MDNRILPSIEHYDYHCHKLCGEIIEEAIKQNKLPSRSNNMGNFIATVLVEPLTLIIPALDIIQSACYFFAAIYEQNLKECFYYAFRAVLLDPLHALCSIPILFFQTFVTSLGIVAPDLAAMGWVYTERMKTIFYWLKAEMKTYCKIKQTKLSEVKIMEPFCASHLLKKEVAKELASSIVKINLQVPQIKKTQLDCFKNLIYLIAQEQPLFFDNVKEILSARVDRGDILASFKEETSEIVNTLLKKFESSIGSYLSLNQNEHYLIDAKEIIRFLDVNQLNQLNEELYLIHKEAPHLIFKTKELLNNISSSLKELEKYSHPFGWAQYYTK